MTNFPNLKNLHLWPISDLHCNTGISKDHQFLLPDLINPKCDDLSERFPISRLSFSSSFYCQHGISHPRQVKSCFLYHYLPFGFNLHIIVPFNQNSRIASLESHFIQFTSWIFITNTAFVLQITAIYPYNWAKMKVTLFEVIDVMEEARQTAGPSSHCANVEISENKTKVLQCQYWRRASIKFRQLQCT